MSTSKQVIVIRKDLNMRKGKIAAQVAHAAMLFLLNLPKNTNWRTLDNWFSEVEWAWITGSFTKIVPYVNSEAELRELILKAQKAGIKVHECVDKGLTEFQGVPTLTCAAFGPDLPEVLDPITGGLPLL